MADGESVIKSVDLLALTMQTDAGRSAGWRTLMEAGPVANVSGANMATTDSAVQYVFQNWELFSSVHAYDVLRAPKPMVPIEFDPPQQTRYRRILAPYFSPGVISRMYDGLREQVRELIAPLAKAGEAEIFSSLAVPFPTQAFLGLFGLPLEDRDRLTEWKDRIVKSTDPMGLEGGDSEAQAELMAYLVEKIEQRRMDLSGDDVLTAVLKDDSPDAMNDDEVLGLCLLLVNAGLDTVTQTLMFMFNALALRPDLQANLVANPDLIPNFAEEVVRLNPVAPFPPRVVTRDTEIEGCPVAAGSHVSACLGAANRDPSQHENPDEIDLQRTSRHWGFGGGPHRCLGSHLARAEMRLVLEEWLKVIPSFRIKGEEPQMMWPVPLLNLEALTLEFEPANG